MSIKKTLLYAGALTATAIWGTLAYNATAYAVKDHGIYQDELTHRVARKADANQDGVLSIHEIADLLNVTGHDDLLPLPDNTPIDLRCNGSTRARFYLAPGPHLEIVLDKDEARIYLSD